MKRRTRRLRNCINFMSQVLSHINRPGEANPGKLNLDDTLIILNMECHDRQPGV